MLCESKIFLVRDQNTRHSTGVHVTKQTNLTWPLAPSVEREWRGPTLLGGEKGRAGRAPGSKGAKQPTAAQRELVTHRR